MPTPSTDIIGDAMKGKYPVVPKIPLAFVHVDDVATAHVNAYEIDDASGRYVLHHIRTEIYTISLNVQKNVPKNEVSQARHTTMAIACGSFARLVHGPFHWEEIAYLLSGEIIHIWRLKNIQARKQKKN